MRQILFGTTVATSGAVSAGSNKALGFSYLASGVPTFVGVSSDALTGKPDNIVLKRTGDAGDVILPFRAKDFRYTKSEIGTASAASSTAQFSSVTFTPGREYTAIVVKKGVKFNERSNWTFTYLADDNTTAAIFAAKFAAWLKANPACGVTTSYTSGTSVTLTAIKAGTAFAVKFTDGLSSVSDIDASPTLVASGVYKVENIAAYLKDLAEKCAADAGFEYTYREAEIYPALYGDGSLDLSPYASGANVYTLFFGEDRDVKTRDEVVNQVVQIVVPSTVDGLDAILALL